MIELTPGERLIWRELRRRVTETCPADPQTSCRTYRNLGSTIDPDGKWRYPMSRPPFRGLNEALGHVTMYEVEYGRPMLSALVVNAETHEPGPGLEPLVRVK